MRGLPRSSPEAEPQAPQTSTKSLLTSIVIVAFIVALLRSCSAVLPVLNGWSSFGGGRQLSFGRQE